MPQVLNTHVAGKLLICSNNSRQAASWTTHLLPCCRLMGLSPSTSFEDLLGTRGHTAGKKGAMKSASTATSRMGLVKKVTVHHLGDGKPLTLEMQVHSNSNNVGTAVQELILLIVLMTKTSHKSCGQVLRSWHRKMLTYIGFACARCVVTQCCQLLMP